MKGDAAKREGQERRLAKHAFEDRPASEVMNEFEAVFARHYQKMKGVTGDK